HKILRRTGRILQSAPNLVTAVNALLFLFASATFGVRKALKTTLITLADPKANSVLYRLTSLLTGFFRGLFRSDLRWQALPVPFVVYADGIDLVVFEEFGAGQAALHLADQVKRNHLMKDEAYRRRFRRDYETRFTPRVWHRDFSDAYVDACPDASLVGKSFGQIAEERELHVVDLFLDLVVEYGRSLRWHTLIANHRPEVRARMMCNPDALIGFADSGAHIRNMAFYNVPLRVLCAVRDAEIAGSPIMPIERAVHRLTGEIADWLGVDAGHLREGDRADMVIIDPEALDARLDVYHEAPMDRFGSLVRMVNRSDGTVSAVLVNGRVAFHDGAFAPDLGQRTGFGSFLPAGQRPAPSEAGREPRPELVMEAAE
ncbi:MAG: N-acyl-D-glutamate amidohydrolase, partial [Polyangiaceae bacterium]